MSINLKFNNLKEIVKECGSAVIAFSGGVDSSFLAKVAYDLLGEQALAVTSTSASFPRSERMNAENIAREIGVPLLFIETRELENQDYTANDYTRCFHCKSELFDTLWNIARKRNLRSVLFGANKDDENDFRPGTEAALRSGARAPLREAELTKEDIRILSKELGLSTWDKPSKACLSSRIPFGEKITAEKLRQIEMAEEALAEIGFGQFRVRHHGDIARIEIGKDQIGLIMEPDTRTWIIEHVKAAGFTFVTIDLEGYRSGPFNPVK